MTDRRPPYDRRQTRPFPRVELAPVSSSMGPTIEQLADIERERRDREDAVDTMESCPAAGCADCTSCNGRHSVECSQCRSHTLDCPGTCSKCSVCLGVHMLTREAIVAWQRENPQTPESA